MKWELAEAKARFEEVYETSLREGAQIIEAAGEEAAVLVPMEEWRRLQGVRPSLRRHLLSPDPQTKGQLIHERGGASTTGQKGLKEWLLALEPKVDDMMIPDRHEWRMREPADF